LLKHDRADLATEFSRFAGHDAFSTYIQGRACLAANDAITASMLFKKAAFGMGKSTMPTLSRMMLTLIQHIQIQRRELITAALVTLTRLSGTC
jgi:hypothetical protein